MNEEYEPPIRVVKNGNTSVRLSTLSMQRRYRLLSNAMTLHESGNPELGMTENDGSWFDDLIASCLFTSKQLQAIVGISHELVKKRMDGIPGALHTRSAKFNPWTLDDLVMLAKYECTHQKLSADIIKRILDNGTSAGMVARIFGIWPKTVSKMAKTGKDVASNAKVDPDGTPVTPIYQRSEPTRSSGTEDLGRSVPAQRDTVQDDDGPINGNDSIVETRQPSTQSSESEPPLQDVVLPSGIGNLTRQHHYVLPDVSVDEALGLKHYDGRTTHEDFIQGLAKIKANDPDEYYENFDDKYDLEVEAVYERGEVDRGNAAPLRQLAAAV